MALLMIALFLIVAVAGRIAIQYRITGDHGVRPSLSGSSKISKFSSILIIAAFFGASFLSLLSFIQVIQINSLFGIWGIITGSIICLAGITITSVSQLQMGKDWRLGVDENETTGLVTQGLYSKVRNPIYSGVMVFGIGLFVLIPTPSMLVILLAGYISIELHVRAVEEPLLKKLHGKVFLDYIEQTGRYIP